MSGQISIKVNGIAQSIDSDQKPTHLFAADSHVVVCKINGELRDLWSDLQDGDEVESVSIESIDGLNVLRHSTAVRGAVYDAVRDTCKKDNWKEEK